MAIETGFGTSTGDAAVGVGERVEKLGMGEGGTGDDVAVDSFSIDDSEHAERRLFRES